VGLLADFLRFVPYVGILLAAALLAPWRAPRTGWGLFSPRALFVVLELIIHIVLEPRFTARGGRLHSFRWWWARRCDVAVGSDRTRARKTLTAVVVVLGKKRAATRIPERVSARAKCCRPPCATTSG